MVNGLEFSFTTGYAPLADKKFTPVMTSSWVAKLTLALTMTGVSA